jgi:cysteinyl-tRNA synthetase
LEQFDAVLGFMDLSAHEMGQEVDAFAERREKARKDKNRELVDRLYEKLLERGIEIIDTREGAACRKPKR